MYSNVRTLQQFTLICQVFHMTKKVFLQLHCFFVFRIMFSAVVFMILLGNSSRNLFMSATNMIVEIIDHQTSIFKKRKI